MVLLLLAGSPLHAKTITGTATLPTQNTDGSAIPSTGDNALARAEWQYGTCNGTAFGTLVSQGNDPVTGTTTSFQFTDVDPGDYCVRVRVVNNAGNASEWAGPVQHTVDASTPNAPVIQTIETTAYVLTPQGKLVRVGTVPVGTECNEPVLYQRGWRNYHEIPESAITWAKQEQGTAVGVCQVTFEARG